jgi:hypothetical protein
VRLHPPCPVLKHVACFALHLQFALFDESSLQMAWERPFQVRLTALLLVTN